MNMRTYPKKRKEIECVRLEGKGKQRGYNEFVRWDVGKEMSLKF